ncbi:Ferredoxin subunit of nitrite reductase or a ring-hydroxylating dioxygenase [Mucilaginibacter polytrichastri]|nr:Ferredoxin subunit of nitrite reductase or a ring-hydroxylating dioxygenase [Mucilaginibacter polytrichastri]
MQRLGLLLIGVLGLISCGKDNSSGIPNVSVNFQSPISDPRYIKLNSVGGAVTVSGYGVAGLVLYHNPDGSYEAFDRCSSYQPEKKCAVTIDNTGFQVDDPCSGSKFSLADGTPVKGPASRSLKSYSIQVANNTIFVSN